MKTILITAGGTSEPIDNIRSITNTGTGALGSLSLRPWEECRPAKDAEGRLRRGREHGRAAESGTRGLREVRPGRHNPQHGRKRLQDRRGGKSGRSA